MWTGIGVIFLIITLAIPVFKWLGYLIIGSGASALGKNDTRKRIGKAYEEERRQSLLDNDRIMTESERDRLLEEYPDTVFVGEEYVGKEEWKNGYGNVCIYKMKKRLFHIKESREIYRERPKEQTAEHGYTNSVYEYIKNVEFLDEVPQDEWMKANSVYSNDAYLEERNLQCIQYCRVVSMLAHKYVYFGDNTDFKDAFIMVLIKDRQITMRFIRECHAANVWKAEHRQLYDCDNYLVGFIEDYEIQHKLNKVAGHDVEIPCDLRHYRPETPSEYAARHIEHEIAKRRRSVQEWEEELSSQRWWGAAFVTTIIGIAFLIWFFSTETNDTTILIKRWGLIIGLIAWALIIAGASVKHNHAGELRQRDRLEEYYFNEFPMHMNLEGRTYANGIVGEIMKHPPPYRYYAYETRNMEQIARDSEEEFMRGIRERKKQYYQSREEMRSYISKNLESMYDIIKYF